MGIERKREEGGKEIDSCHSPGFGGKKKRKRICILVKAKKRRAIPANEYHYLPDTAEKRERRARH